MPLKRFLLALILLSSVTDVGLCTECDSTAEKVNLDLWSTRSLLSPNQRWKFLSVGPHSPETRAPLYIQNTESSKKWIVGWIERNGTAFWSGDSKRLFLRDEYAADDTKIRVFNVTGAVPKEIKGLDDKIQKALFAHIPQNKTTQWLYYPEVCFAANNSSTIIVVADAPLVPKKESGSGKSFGLKLIVNLDDLHVIDSVSTTQLPKPTGEAVGSAVAAPSDWHKVDAGPFSIFAPPGWEFHQLPGVDTYVGEFVGDGFALTFDFGSYARGCFKEYKKLMYATAKESIGGLSARIVSPRTPGHGITGVYFHKVSNRGAFCLWGKDLTGAQQELALKIFKTTRFGGPMPKYLLPPPPPLPRTRSDAQTSLSAWLVGLPDI
jgi:hypothetical protein